MQTSQPSNNTPRRHRGQNIPPQDKPAIQAAFLAAFADLGIIRAACEKAGISSRLVYAWRESDPAFADALEHATRDANDVIRKEIHRRGVTGWVETTTTVETDPDGVETRKTVKTRKYSDAMLRMLAMARMPEYRDRLDVTSAGEQLGAYAAIASVADDPHKSEAASDLLAIIAGDSLNAGRPGVDSEPG